MRHDQITSSATAMREMHRRMQGPQRHRLLHGYPLTAAMSRRTDAAPEEDVRFDPDSGRRLLVGVLPHPFCNPSVTGCGFCTFPHQSYNSNKAQDVVESVIQEIQQQIASRPALHRRRVAALYFGGATANLTPPDSFRRLCRQLAESLDLSDAEVTLEGVPAYFVKRRPLLLDLLREELPARHYRISMGIQTFAEHQLRRMGRLAFGTASTFREVVEMAHRRGFTVSGDFLFNLPNQRLDEMREDMRRAIDIGLDHLGLYHLVLFAGLGTEWSHDAAMLAGLPTNLVAAEHWLELRQLLLSQRFRQTTLTNFERAEFKDSDQRFVYEEYSFQPDICEVLGFGPTAISFAADRPFQSGRKTLNPESASAYTQAVPSNRGAWNHSFTYDRRDLRIVYLTRRLAALNIDRSAYSGLFHTDATADFPYEFAAMQRAALVEITPTAIRPTPLGMFYADSIAGLLASARIEERRRTKKRSVRRSGPKPMGLQRVPQSTLVRAPELVDQERWSPPPPTPASAGLSAIWVGVVAIFAALILIPEAPLLLLVSSLVLLGVLLFEAHSLPPYPAVSPIPAQEPADVVERESQEVGQQPNPAESPATRSQGILEPRQEAAEADSDPEDDENDNAAFHM